MLKVAHIKIQSRIKITGPCDPFTLMRGICQRCPLSMLLHITVAEVLANLINTNTMIKGIQIGDLVIKIVNFAEGITILLGGINCLNRIKMILKFMKKHLALR